MVKRTKPIPIRYSFFPPIGEEPLLQQRWLEAPPLAVRTEVLWIAWTTRPSTVPHLRHSA
jgi:hypothetical protein